MIFHGLGCIFQQFHGMGPAFLNFRPMRYPSAPVRALTFTGICILIHIYARNPERVESGYSTQFYPLFGSFLRQITGFVPFSIGDIFYGMLIGWLLYALMKKLFRLFRKKEKETSEARWYWIWLSRLAIVYIVFNLFWGVNYNRTGAAGQLGITVRDYTVEELKDLNCVLLDSMNHNRAAMAVSGNRKKSKKEMFEHVSVTYQALQKKYPFLGYQNPSIKSSFWGWFGNYAGFTGYYNPFTGEAQVNTTVPDFLQPFIACHEVAHQLGYARENEANFVGFLAARASPDPSFRYSAYLDLFTYANRSLYALDSIAAELVRRDMSRDVKDDIAEWVRFSRKHRNPIEPLIRWAYGKYLEGNQQPKGIFSYDEVTAYLVAYRKKFGSL